MSFLHPAYLWGLLTLTIPIAIHLLSRKEGKVIRVGSLRHIDESNTSQFKSIRLNEFLLLLLRLLMISALVLFLSGAQCTNPNLVKPTRWLVIENGVDQEPMAANLIDSLTADGYETRQLASGFPLLKRGAEKNAVNYWQLSDELARLNNHHVIVMAYNHARNFVGKRRTLPSTVQWIVVDTEVTNTRYAVNAVQLPGDSVRLQVAETTPTATVRSVSFINNRSANKWLTLRGLDSVAVEDVTTIKIAVQSDKGFEKDKEIMISALNVISDESGVAIVVENGESKSVDWTISLTREMPVLRTHHIYYQAQLNGELLEPTGPTNYRITKRITNEVALKDNLVINLGGILLPALSTPDQPDRRVLAEQMAWAATGGVGETVRNAKTDLSKYLLIAFFALWIGERLVAWRKNQ
jgi:hypothetical protein